MTVPNETVERYQLLEELLAIPGAFGFSIPRMHVLELLTHRGREYHFTYDNRKNAFITFVYDAYQKKVQSIKVSKNRTEEMYADKARFTKILKQIEHRILEKNEALPFPHAAEYEGFLNQTRALTATTDRLIEELVVLENKDAIKEALDAIQTQIAGVQELIEQQKLTKLKETLSLIDY